jgi:hypothetical protein
MEETMDKSHNKRAFTIITGKILSIAGFVLGNISGLNPEKKNIMPESRNTVTIASTKNEK